jgi:hypothetical protein
VGRYVDSPSRVQEPGSGTSQANAGVEATRNRGMAEAKGEYFIPMMPITSQLPTWSSALSRDSTSPRCLGVIVLFLGLQGDSRHCTAELFLRLPADRGPHVMGSIENVCGDTPTVRRHHKDLE